MTVSATSAPPAVSSTPKSCLIWVEFKEPFASDERNKINDIWEAMRRTLEERLSNLKPVAGGLPHGDTYVMEMTSRQLNLASGTRTIELHTIVYRPVSRREVHAALKDILEELADKVAALFRE